MSSFKIMGRIETLEYIIKNNVSVSRFGDGELMVMWYGNTRFQRRTKALKKALIDVVNSDDEGFLVCLPHQLVTYDGLNPASKKWYRKQLLWTRPLWKYYVKDKNKIYGDTCISRPWMSFKDIEKAERSFTLLKKLWDGKDLVIIEGDKTRCGVNNDLFKNARSIERIIGPAEDAFSVIDDIYKEALKMDKSKVFILALGPAASVLAYRLFKAGYTAYDLGHMDVEYEWFKLRSDGKIAIPGKYVNEAGGGKSFTDIDDLKEYESQIIAKIN